MQVIAHMILANLQEDVQLLLCDPDEYLAVASPASLADVFDDCLQVGAHKMRALSASSARPVPCAFHIANTDSSSMQAAPDDSNSRQSLGERSVSLVYC